MFLFAHFLSSYLGVIVHNRRIAAMKFFNVEGYRNATLTSNDKAEERGATKGRRDVSGSKGRATNRITEPRGKTTGADDTVEHLA
jgi:hypothetical protein